ncbi:MAG: response regulator, partial [Planctomycetes bacterium]|nr:response regulator [Planctomycetota bacterium]
MNASNAALKTLAGRNRRPVVLCLDDDPAVLGSLRRLLGREPYEVVTTHNPNEALARMCRSTVDVIIADELMPRISGMAFLKIVEGRWPATARLIVSGHPDVPERVKGEARLVQHFIPKPWDVDELRTLLRGLIDRRRPGPAQAVRLPRRRPAWDFMVERPVLIEATGRTATELQSRLLRFLSRARLEGRDVVAVLEGLDQMKGDARTLLGHVAMAVDSSGVRLHLVDGSCTATEYFRSAEAFHPRIKVYDPSPAELASKDLLLVDPVAPRRVFL